MGEGPFPETAFSHHQWDEFLLGTGCHGGRPSFPILLGKVGQDLAQSSSIIRTTVTDVVGFLNFLDLATIFASVL